MNRDKKPKVSEKKLEALKKAREVRKANIALRKAGKEPIKKKAKPEVEYTTNKKGKKVSAARQRAGMANVKKRKDRMAKEKDKISDEFFDTVESALTDLEEMKPFEYSDSKPASRKKPMENDIVLDMVAEMHKKSSRLVDCLVDFQKMEYDDKTSCQIALIHTLEYIVKTIQKLDDYAEWVRYIDPDIQEFYKDSFIDLMKESTAFLTVLLNSY